jgi:nucleoside-diphosphate-sugar epimerase
MRILILGGTHFIGRHIAETLLAAGHTLTPALSPMREAGLIAIARQFYKINTNTSGIYENKIFRPIINYPRPERL